MVNLDNVLKELLKKSLAEHDLDKEFKDDALNQFYFILYNYDEVLVGEYINDKVRTRECKEEKTYTLEGVLKLILFNEYLNCTFKNINGNLKIYKPLLKNDIKNKDFEKICIEIDPKFSSRKYNKLNLMNVYDYDENNLAYVKYQYLDSLK